MSKAQQNHRFMILAGIKQPVPMILKKEGLAHHY